MDLTGRKRGVLKNMNKKVKIIIIVTAVVTALAAALGAGMLIGSSLKQIETKETVAKIKDEPQKGLEKDSIKEAEVPDFEETEPQKPDRQFVVALDPGHQGPNVDMSAKEENAPGSGVMKQRATTGTTGRYSGLPEYQLNLDIAMKVKERLTRQGIQVVMTREDNDTAVSNQERAKLANDAGADISVRIHANGSESADTSGALCLVMSGENPYVGSLYEESSKLAQDVLDSYCSATGFQSQGIQENDTMTGINWSQIPVMILEMGFMTNEQDDLAMADAAFQEKMADGIAEGILKYCSEKQAAGTDSSLIQSKLNEIISTFQAGGTWAAYVHGLDSLETAVAGNAQMQSASLIKLFIAGTVYENLDQLTQSESYAGEIEALLETMITVSDNPAANNLIKKLGDGDAKAGMEKVNQYCAAKGYAQTHLGRQMLDFDAQDDNYTSVEDCGKFLEDIYYSRLPGSEKIIERMKRQTRREKIPAGVPDGIVTANKTGELTDVENDAAIIWGENQAYILCVMSSDLAAAGEAKAGIVRLSEEIYKIME